MLTAGLSRGCKIKIRSTKAGIGRPRSILVSKLVEINFTFVISLLWVSRTVNPFRAPSFNGRDQPRTATIATMHQSMHNTTSLAQHQPRYSALGQGMDYHTYSGPKQFTTFLCSTKTRFFWLRATFSDILDLFHLNLGQITLISTILIREQILSLNGKLWLTM